MAAPHVPALPPAPQRGAAPAIFQDEADPFVAALDPWGQAANDLGDFVNTKADAVDVAAAAATAAAAAAATSAATAQTAPGTKATSSSNLTITAVGTSLVYVLNEANKTFGVGLKAKATSRSDITKFAIGTVTAFPDPVTAKQLTIKIESLGSLGATANDWDITYYVAAPATVADISDYASDQATKAAVINARIDPIAQGKEAPVALAIVAGVVTINLAGENTDFTLALTANVTSMVISNPPASGTKKTFSLRITFNGTTYTFAWAAAVKHMGGTTPSFSFTNGKEAAFGIWTDDAGTKYHAAFIGESG